LNPFFFVAGAGGLRVLVVCACWRFARAGGLRVLTVCARWLFACAGGLLRAGGLCVGKPKQFLSPKPRLPW
jgi:hypothetical protein